MEAAGLPVEPDLIVRSGLNREDGEAAALDLLRRADRPPGAWRLPSRAERGLRIPGDLSVVGFDDLPLAPWSIRADHVHQPLIEMAVNATELAPPSVGERTAQIGLELATPLTARQGACA